MSEGNPTPTLSLERLDERVKILETEHVDMKFKLDTLTASAPASESVGGRRQKQRQQQKQQRQQQKQKQQQQQQQQSGGDASNHALAVFGALGQQQAQPGTNMIASRPVGQAGGSGLALLSPSALSAGSSVPPADPQKGGRRTRKQRQQKQQRKTKHSRQ